MSCMSLAEQAHEAAEGGDFRRALLLLRQAMATFKPEDSSQPDDEEEAEKDWPAYWEGACMVLDQVAAWRQTVWVTEKKTCRTLWAWIVYVVRLHRQHFVDLLRHGIG